eukprot:1234824-Prymnesium_polylepis.1
MAEARSWIRSGPKTGSDAIFWLARTLYGNPTSLLCLTGSVADTRSRLGTRWTGTRTAHGYKDSMCFTM